MHLILNQEIEASFSTEEPIFQQIMRLRGESFRKLEGRHTQRIHLAGKPYFIKQHFGVGWVEILKNIFQLRLPVTSAKNEWLAINALQKLEIPTQEIIGFGLRGFNPATQKSFLITRELPQFITLEELGKQWQLQPPPFLFKIQLIQEVARIARLLHTNGINHRDFYICHFLLDLIEYPYPLSTKFLGQDQAGKSKIKIYLIDLHRAQIRSKTPLRWIIKDLAGLYFSSRGIGLTQKDYWRFMKYYSQQSLRHIFHNGNFFWRKVKKRGDKLFRKHESQ